MARRKIAIGTQIDRIFKLREKLNVDQKKVDEGKAQLDGMKKDLIDSLEVAGIDGSRGTAASVSIKVAVTPTVQDWDQFYTYLYDNRMAHMMFKRISDVAYREQLELRDGEDIPGVIPFERKTLSIRKRTDT